MKEKYEKPEVLTFESPRRIGQGAKGWCSNGTNPSLVCATGSSNVASCGFGSDVGASLCSVGSHYSTNECSNGIGATDWCSTGSAGFSRPV